MAKTNMSPFDKEEKIPVASQLSRKKLVYGLAFVCVALIVGGLLLAQWRISPQPAAKEIAPAPAGAAEAPAIASAASSAASVPQKASSHQAAPGEKHTPQKAAPLPELVPGNPLNDELFAQISAEIVIAAVGLKQDQNWTLNVMAYMEKALKRHGISVEDYTAYAHALYQYPDRGRAVAENIMQRVEKKLGYKVKVEALPLYKWDEQTINQLRRKLQER